MAPEVGKSFAAAARGRVADRPLALAAVFLVGIEASLAVADVGASVVSLVALLVAPGLALAPLMPESVRQSLAASLAAAPAFGSAAVAVALITLASAGVELDATSVRLTLALLVLAGLALPGQDPVRLDRDDALGAAGLLAAVAAGVVLQSQVIGGNPVPGNDWAKYVLYADEIRKHGFLLIDNPFWMLGVPFREDPAAPALEGSFLILTGQPAGVLVHGIWAAALIGIGSMFAYARAIWGPLAGALAAGLLAVLPISQDILAWHGLANAAALALFPLLLGYATHLVRAELRVAQALGFGLTVVALAASHRLSLLVAGMALLLVIAIVLARADRRAALRGAMLSGTFALVLAPGVAYDLVERQRSFGGTQEYEAYLSAKVNLGPVIGDLSVIFSVLALVAVALALRAVRHDRALIAPLCLLGVTTGLAYGWLAHVPLPYFRMAYFLPVALVPLVAVGFTRLPQPRRAALAGALVCAAIAIFAWMQTSNVRDFYAFTNQASLRGLDAVAADLRPGEVMVTDRCWSFLTTWLLQTPTIAALEREDIQPRGELRRARQARAVLDATPNGLDFARRLAIRYVIVDPTCTDARERPTRPPLAGTPVFVSRRMVVLRLAGS